jgi:hypothetical protein
MQVSRRDEISPVRRVLERFDMIYGGNSKSTGLPRGMVLVARMLELQAEQAWDPMASSGVNFGLNAHRTKDFPLPVIPPGMTTAIGLYSPPSVTESASVP